MGSVLNAGLTMPDFILAHGFENCATATIRRGNTSKMVMEMCFDLPLRFDQKSHAPFVA